jgi:hypothetical protein
MTFDEGVVFNRVDDVTLRNVRIDGGFWINGSTNVSIIGGSVGPCVGCHPDIQWEYNSSPVRIPKNIVIDGVYFHDVVISAPGDHVECLQVSDVDGLVVRNSRFHRCGIFDLHIAGTVDPPVRNVLVENNFFEPAVDGGFYSLSITDGINVTVRNNSSSQEFRFGASTTIFSNWLVVGNVAPYSGAACQSVFTYSRNVWEGGRCGSTDLNVDDLGFVNPGAGDYHLKSTSPAIDAGDPSSYPATDIDGQARPLGAAPDAGADEAR